jgi:hypothetical protein
MSKNASTYVKNSVLTDLLDNMSAAVSVERSLRKRGQGEHDDDGLKRLEQGLQDLRELEVAWLTLQDLVDMEDRTLEGLHSGAPTAREWSAVFDRARELFTSPSIVP